MPDTLFDMGEKTRGKAKPFLKWVGGKRQILKHLIKLLPPDVENRIYREPFLGGGALFFAINPRKAFISDLNRHLIMAYEQIRDNTELVYGYLNKHRFNNSRNYYYEIRELFNKNINKSSVAQAARFIYLNKTCYNGVFRVNSKGLFNVPYGRYDATSLPSLKHLRKVSDVLQSKKIFVASFDKALEQAKEGDFIYLDPPYPPQSNTSCFNHYTCSRFTEKDQERLATIVRELDKAGCLLMISNGNNEKILELYKGFKVHPYLVTRFITCKKKRDKIQELVITNYEV